MKKAEKGNVRDLSLIHISEARMNAVLGKIA